MLKTFSTLHSIRISSIVNRILYYAQRFPLVGKKIKNKQYANLELKQAMTIIALLIHISWGFLSKFAYLGLIVYLPAVVWNGNLSQEDQLATFMNIFLILSFVVAGVVSTIVMETKREKYVAVKLMRMKPEMYMKASLAYRYFSYFIYYIPAMLLFTLLLNIPLLQGLCLAASITLWRIVCEYLHLKLFQKTDFVLIKKNSIIWIAIGLGFGTAYAPILLNWTPSFGMILLQWPVTAIIVVLGIITSIKLKNYSEYREAVDAATKRDDPLLDLSRMVTEANQTQVKSKNIDYQPIIGQALPQHHQEGFAYLNALFFARHRSLIKKLLWSRIINITAVGLIALAFAVLFTEMAASFTEKWSIGVLYLIILMNSILIGERTCKTMFYNCDLSLLRYSFYRNAAPQHFLIRLYRICGLNLIIATVFGVAITGFALTAGGVPIEELLITLACVYGLAIFYSIHDLTMYYLLQPYSTELNIKNPFFFLINIAISLIFVVVFVLRTEILTLAISIFILSIIYFLVAISLVKNYGPRTFRVK